MTKEELNEYRRNSAALIAAAMAATAPRHMPPYEAPEDATDEYKRRVSDARAQFEREQNQRRANMALEAFLLAGALCAENEIWEGPTDDEGNPLDPRAFDPFCTHGRKQSEECPDCAREVAAREAAKAANAELPAGTDMAGQDER